MQLNSWSRKHAHHCSQLHASYFASAFTRMDRAFSSYFSQQCTKWKRVYCMLLKWSEKDQLQWAYAVCYLSDRCLWNLVRQRAVTDLPLCVFSIEMLLLKGKTARQKTDMRRSDWKKPKGRQCSSDAGNKQPVWDGSENQRLQFSLPLESNLGDRKKTTPPLALHSHLMYKNRYLFTRVKND